MENIYVNNPTKMYQDALSIQDASNVIAVVNTFKEVLIAANRNKNNPAVIAMFDKINDLMGRPYGYNNLDTIYQAFKDCERLSSVDQVIIPVQQKEQSAIIEV